MTPDEIRATFGSWVANLGRAPHEGEREEWARVYRDASAEIVRQAIDEYVASAPRYASLMGLRVVYARLLPDDLRQAEAAGEWVKRDGFRAYGFAFTGERAPLSAQKVREACATHETAMGDAGRTLAAWSTEASAEARDRMRSARRNLTAAGYEYAPEPGSVAWRPWAWLFGRDGDHVEVAPLDTPGVRDLARLHHDAERWNAGERADFGLQPLEQLRAERWERRG